MCIFTHNIFSFLPKNLNKSCTLCKLLRRRSVALAILYLCFGNAFMHFASFTECFSSWLCPMSQKACCHTSMAHAFYENCLVSEFRSDLLRCNRHGLQKRYLRFFHLHSHLRSIQVHLHRLHRTRFS